MKHKDWKAEQRRINKTLRRVNQWISMCLSPDIMIRQTNRMYNSYDDLMYYELSFIRGNVHREVYAPEDLMNHYVKFGLFDFISSYAKDLRDKVNFRLCLLNGYEFLWDDYGYYSKFQRKGRRK